MHGWQYPDEAANAHKGEAVDVAKPAVGDSNVDPGATGAGQSENPFEHVRAGR